MGELDGRSALVTGAGIGIGQGVAIGLAQRGARVAVHYASSSAGAEATVADITRAGGEAVLIKGDLQQAAECRRVVDEAAAAFGGLDILVNNAGVTRMAPFLEMTEAIYDEMFDLNMKGYFFCAQRAVHYMEQSGRGGRIVNMTSVHGYAGVPQHAAYAGTKGAISAFTRSLAMELATRNIRVNAIGPGLIEVPRYFDDPGYSSERGASWVPINRVGTPADIAGAVCFLVSDGADFITGQTLYVDGGTTANMGMFQR